MFVAVLLVAGVALAYGSVLLAGIGLYTQSYTALTATLDQVAGVVRERRTTAALRFDKIEKDLLQLKRRMDINVDDLNDMDSSGLDVENPSSSRLLSAVGDREEEDADDDNGNKSLLLRTRTPKQERESELLDEMVAVKEKLRIETSQATELERYIQATSMRDATRKYGGGVVRVQLDLDFPEDRENSSGSSGNGNSNRLNGGGNKNDGSSSSTASSSSSGTSSSTVLILEMAPLELMPHSVYTFLEMVHAELFDGCSFILNAMHVVKAAPLPYNGGSTSQKVRAFTKHGLDTVSFREYSPEYPHEKFTVGFAADGSPSFYINTGDNTEMHTGEPCFARIVSGFETLERLEEAPVRNGMWYRKRIGIKRARIL